MKNKHITILVLSILVTLFIGCNNEKSSNKGLTIHRFDKALDAAFRPMKFEEADITMKKEYPHLFPFYIERLMGIGDATEKKDDMYYGNYFMDFYRGEYRAIMDTIAVLIDPHVSDQELKLETAYNSLIKQFPEVKKPHIYSFFVSPMGANPVAAFSYGEDTVGINWFHYFGENFSLYPSIYEGYNYMVKWNKLDYLVRNIMLVEYNLIAQRIQKEQSESELIYQMIAEGKKYYYLDIVCPDMKDEIKIGYSKEELEWCEKNRKNIWAYFIENKLLYNNGSFEATKFTQPGPNTPGMPKESPGMVGSWIGWQIVKAYANKHKVSLKKIIETKNTEIMTESNFKP